MKKMLNSAYVPYIAGISFALFFLAFAIFDLVSSGKGDESDIIQYLLIVVFGSVLIYCFLSILSVRSHGMKYVNAYIARSGFSEERLNEGFLFAQRIATLWMGDRHLFFTDGSYAYVMPYEEISDLKLTVRLHHSSKHGTSKRYCISVGSNYDNSHQEAYIGFVEGTARNVIATLQERSGAVIL